VSAIAVGLIQLLVIVRSATVEFAILDRPRPVLFRGTDYGT